MALRRSKIQDPIQLADSVGTIYTNPASTKTYIRGIIFFNDNTSPELIRLYVVPDTAGAVGTASGANKILEYGMATKETYQMEFRQPIVLDETNETLQGFSTTASKVTCVLLGDRDP